MSYDDLVYSEECFDLRVTALTLQPDGLCTVERRREPYSGAELFLNEYEGHFSLVTNPDAFTLPILSVHARSVSFYQAVQQQHSSVHRVC